MATLTRFRKPGGLLQLIRLIESSDAGKRKQLLALIAKEDPGWAHMVQVKALNFERIMNWPDSVLELVLESMPSNFVGALLQLGSQEDTDKIIRCLNPKVENEVRQKNAEREIGRQEKALAHNKLLQVVRELQDQGVLNFATFDPGLDIDLRLAG